MYSSSCPTGKDFFAAVRPRPRKPSELLLNLNVQELFLSRESLRELALNFLRRRRVHGVYPVHFVRELIQHTLELAYARLNIPWR